LEYSRFDHVGTSYIYKATENKVPHLSFLSLSPSCEARDLIRGIKPPKKLENAVPRQLEKIRCRLTSSFVLDGMLWDHD